MEKLVQIVSLTRKEEEAWLTLRAEFIPELSHEEHCVHVRTQQDNDARYCAFGAYLEQRMVGLGEFSLRYEYVNGCNSSPVCYLELLFVQPQARSSGLGKQLLLAGENWGRKQKCQEMATDTFLGDEAAITFYLRTGMKETERVVYFKKNLNNP